MTRFMWILLILLIILSLAQFWKMENRDTPPWVKCKESLFVQTIFNKCTALNKDINQENLSIN